MLKLETLNPEQRACVEHLRGPLVLIAGAGTGKTRVITYRIAHMLARGIRPDEIVAMTFTNKAAREMAERLETLAGSAFRKLSISTFHSFCLKLLKEHHKAAGLPPRFTIIGTGDQIELVKRCQAEADNLAKISAYDLHQALSHAKNHLWTPKDLRERVMPHMVFNLDPNLVADALELYARQLSVHEVVDFDDLIYRCVGMLESNPEVREAIENRYRYFLVDEFQDTNQAQLRVVELLCSKHRNVCVVGDDDQSIYSWRGAVGGIFSLFEGIFPERNLLKLEQNYRCTSTILDAANAVIKNNRGRKDKTLWSKKSSDVRLSLRSFPNETEEAQAIADRCYTLMGRGKKIGDMAILYRSNAQARALEIALRERHLHYLVFGGQSMFDRKECKDLLAYIRFILRPNDRLSFARIINTPSRGVGLRTLEKIVSLSAEKKVPLLEACTTANLDVTTRTRAALEEFSSLVRGLQAGLPKSPGDMSTFVQEVTRRFRLEAEIRHTANTPESADVKVMFLRKMPQWLEASAKRFLEKQERWDLRSMMDEFSLEPSQNEDKSDDGERRYISLMTVHAAKGLEFDVVFVCGLQDGVFPHQHNVAREELLAEERRLFYVAITRAKEELYLSYAQERQAAGRTDPQKASRFLKEIPDPLVQHELLDEDLMILNPEEKRERRRQRLSDLRQSLKQG